MNWPTVVLHWLHVLFAVTWFGGHISRVLLVEPAVRTLPESAQQQFNRYVERYATRHDTERAQKQDDAHHGRHADRQRG